MSRQSYIVTYDICEPRRLRMVFETVRAHGQHVQLSVFRCELSRAELIELRDELDALIKHDEDQILFIDLGPAEGRGRTCISSLGRRYTPPERRVKIF